MDDSAHFGADGKGGRIGDGVVHVDKLHLELAGPDCLSRFHSGDLGLLGQAVLFELQFDQPAVSLVQKMGMFTWRST